MDNDEDTDLIDITDETKVIASIKENHGGTIGYRVFDGHKVKDLRTEDLRKILKEKPNSIGGVKLGKRERVHAIPKPPERKMLVKDFHDSITGLIEDKLIAKRKEIKYEYWIDNKKQQFEYRYFIDLEVYIPGKIKPEVVTINITAGHKDTETKSGHRIAYLTISIPDDTDKTGLHNTVILGSILETKSSLEAIELSIKQLSETLNNLKTPMIVSELSKAYRLKPRKRDRSKRKKKINTEETKCTH